MTAAAAWQRYGERYEPVGRLSLPRSRRMVRHSAAVLMSCRYDEESILAELGTEFQLRETRRETHITPWQSEQRFIYFRLVWQGE